MGCFIDWGLFFAPVCVITELDQDLKSPVSGLIVPPICGVIGARRDVTFMGGGGDICTSLWNIKCDITNNFNYSINLHDVLTQVFQKE